MNSSHIDDPTVEAPKQGNDSDSFLAKLPKDMTQEDLVTAVKQATGKTEDEMLVMDRDSLQKLIDQTFKSDVTNSKAEKQPDPPDGQPDGKKDDHKDPSQAADPAEKPKEEEEKEVTVSIKPSLLKPFSNGKDLKEAIADAVRQAQENGTAVNLFKKQTIPNLRSEIEAQEFRISQAINENKTLKSQLEELRSRIASAPAPADQNKGDDKLPDIPDLPDEFDPLDPDHREQFVNALNVMRKRDEILQKRLESKAVQTPPPPPPPSAPAGDRSSVDAATKQQERAAAEEFNFVRSVQNNSVFGDVFKTSSDIQTVNDNYVDFGKKLAEMVGIKTPIGEDGLFTPATQKLIHQYYNDEGSDGESLRVGAKTNNINPPSNEDLLALKRVTALRSIQRERLIRDGQGNAVPIPAEEAFAIATHRFPQLFSKKDDLQQRREEHDRLAKAAANRSKHTTDVPPSIGADVDNLSKIPVETLLKILNKPQDKWTVEEAELVKKTAKANNLSDEEIQFYIDQQKK